MHTQIECLRTGSAGSGEGSWVLHDVGHRHVLASHSSPSLTPTAHVIQVPDVSASKDRVPQGSGVTAERSWQLTGRECTGAKMVEGISWEVVQVQAPDDEGVGGLYDAILLDPPNAIQKGLEGGLAAEGEAEAAQRPKLPLIAYPHGGPHSNMGTEHYASVALLVLQGFSVLLVNFRGSTGYGQGPLESLFGNVGRKDVDDVKAAVAHVLATRAHLDAARVGACGGSHGGFLSLHLVGQYPELFRAAAVRNPVTNIATMYGATDIPDWCYTETGSTLAYAQPTAEQYARALRMSPMAYVSQIVAPVLLLVGGDDRRVPPFQSKEFFYALRERVGDQVEMLWYDKHTHGLQETPKGEGDGLTNICYFFKRHL